MYNHERRYAVTNNIFMILFVYVIASVALWTILYYAYSIDRSSDEAFVGASMNVLLVSPTLASYYLVMELSRRLSIWKQIALVLIVALLWLPIQRTVIYPSFGLVAEFGENISNMILSSGFGILSWFAVRSFLYRRRLSEALKLQKQSELQLLNAQLAPHTLFNMMNTVYSVMLENQENSIPLFLSMTEMLRHLVEATQKPWSTASEEVTFINNYATIEKARNPDGVSIVFDTEGDLDAPVPPMMFASLFENAVKHGRFPDGHVDITCQLVISEDIINFVITNTCPDNISSSNSLGTGNASIKRRLELIYPGSYVFDVGRDGSCFTARIKIML